jgi:hypothetical protein
MRINRPLVKIPMRPNGHYVSRRAGTISSFENFRRQDAGLKGSTIPAANSQRVEESGGHEKPNR